MGDMRGPFDPRWEACERETEIKCMKLMGFDFQLPPLPPSPPLRIRILRTFKAHWGHLHTYRTTNAQPHRHKI